MSAQTPPSLGLVLSGGGMRGIAHLGVLTVLEECGIRPVAISGTSAGALVGAFYAAGHPIPDILRFFKEANIFKIGNFAFSKPGFIDPEKFLPLFLQYFPENDFNALKIKHFVTATDLIHGRSKTFHEGALIPPLMASAAVPAVFSPVEIEGSLYVDGGMLNNFPIEPLTGLCDAIIGVNVHPLKDKRPEDFKYTFAVMERVMHLGAYFSAIQKFHLCDVVIAPQALADFGTFERGRMEEIFEIGYRAADEKRGELMALVSR